jgi:hypothetical protein
MMFGDGWVRTSVWSSGAEIVCNSCYTHLLNYVKSLRSLQSVLALDVVLQYVVQQVLVVVELLVCLDIVIFYMSLFNQELYYFVQQFVQQATSLLRHFDRS